MDIEKLIQIKEYPIKPVSVRGRCFRRVENSNRVMTPQEIAQMHLSCLGMSWDAFSARDSSMDDIDLEEVGGYIKNANSSGRRRFEISEDSVRILEKIELLSEKKPTWAAIVLFGKDPQSKLSQSTVHCGRFKQETIIIDDKMIRGTALEQVEEVMDFIRKSSNLPMPVFDEKFGGFLVIFRKDIYTEENLRKLGVNERQIKAVMCVKEKGSIHLSSFKNIVPEVSEKTLYRDLQNLVNKRVLKELGEKKGRKYELR